MNTHDYIRLGDQALAQQQWQDAQKHYKQAVALNPCDPMVYLRLAELAEQQNHLEQAVNYRQVANQYTSNQKPTHDHSGIGQSTTHQTPNVGNLNSSNTRGTPTPEELDRFHNFDLSQIDWQHFRQNPKLLGLTFQDLAGKSERQQLELLVGEYFTHVARRAGKIASDFLFSARWAHGESEWFDHRQHLLDPERWYADYWTLSADNVIPYLPFGGTMLDFCSGDGFYDYYYYAKRAKEVVCVEFDEEVFRHAVRLHQSQNIQYILGSILDYTPDSNYYDVVVIRGAIEHFTQEQQQSIFQKALQALKPGGWFCGDTPANPDKGKVLLSHHENEWADEYEMRQELELVFHHVEAYSVKSADRTTLFWRCKKI
jgi:SAM-dependent methyltransferase